MDSAAADLRWNPRFTVMMPKSEAESQHDFTGGEIIWLRMRPLVVVVADPVSNLPLSVFEDSAGIEEDAFVRQ